MKALRSMRFLTAHWNDTSAGSMRTRMIHTARFVDLTHRDGKRIRCKKHPDITTLMILSDDINGMVRMKLSCAGCHYGTIIEAPATQQNLNIVTQLTGFKFFHKKDVGAVLLNPRPKPTRYGKEPK